MAIYKDIKPILNTLEPIPKLEKDATDFDKGFNSGLRFAIHRIKSNPIADVRENNFGHWVELPEEKRYEHNGASYYCSECSRVSQYKTNYCASCGADMRLGRR